MKLGYTLIVAALLVLGGTTLTTASAASPVLATGQAMVNGSPAANAQVDLYLADLPTMATGSTVSPTQVASTTTDASGSYTLSVPASSVQGAANANGGYVNFEQDTTATDGTMNVVFYAEQLNSDGSWSAGESDGPPSTVALTIPPAMQPYASPDNGCHTLPRITTLHTGQAWTTVGETHDVTNEQSRYAYSEGDHASTNIEVGISSNNINFTSGGTNYRGESGTVIWPLASGEFGHQAQTIMHYGYYRTYYPCTANTIYSKRSNDWIGGSRWGHDNHNLDHHCSNYAPWKRAPFAPGSQFIKHEGYGVTWGTSVSVWGTGLYARSAWSSDVEDHHYFGTKYVRYWMCGDNAGPVSSNRDFLGW